MINYPPVFLLVFNISQQSNLNLHKCPSNFRDQQGYNSDNYYCHELKSSVAKYCKVKVLSPSSKVIKVVLIVLKVIRMPRMY